MDLQDWDDAGVWCSPSGPVSGTETGLSPLPSRERGIRRLCCLVVTPHHTLPLWIADQVRNDGCHALLHPVDSRLRGNDNSGVQDWYDGAYCWVGFMGLLCYEVAVRGRLVEPYVFES